MDFSKGPAIPPVFTGHMATATVYPDRVVFKRPLWARLGGNRSSTVLLGDVLKILHEEPTLTLNGYVHLATVQDEGMLRTVSQTLEKAVAGNSRADHVHTRPAGHARQVPGRGRCGMAEDRAWTVTAPPSAPTASKL
jgi:hypothetical protein